MSLNLTRTEIKELIGKRVTINGERTRVESVKLKSREFVTREGDTYSVDDLYKRGPGFFIDFDEKPAKKTKKAKAEKPAKKAKAEKPAKKAKAEKPAKKAKAEKPAKKAKAEKPVKERSKKARRKVEETKGGDVVIDMDNYTPAKTKKKKLKTIESFDQAIATKVADQLTALVDAIREASGFDLTYVSTGAVYNNTTGSFTITLGKSGMTDKEVQKILSQDSYSDDISSEDDLDDLDDIDTEDAEDFDEEDLDEEDEDSGEEDFDDDEEDLEEEDEDLDEEEDEDLDEEEDEDLDEEDDEEELDKDDLFNAISEAAPNLREDTIWYLLDGYYDSEEIEDLFGDELIPGITYLTEKGKRKAFLLVGYDAKKECIRLLNTNGKLRSKTLKEVTHMEIVE